MATFRDWKKTLKGNQGFHLTDEFINYTEGRIYIARDGKTASKEYNSVDSWQQLYEAIMICDPSSVTYGACRNFYEYFRENQRVKLYFDFEIRGPFAVEDSIIASTTADDAGTVLKVRPTEDEVKAHIEHICKHAVDTIKEFYNIDISIDWFAATNSSSADKISYHLVLTKGIYFQDCGHLKNFVGLMFSKEMLNDSEAHPHFSGIDAGVYGNGRLFRLPLCSKKGEVRPLIMDPRFTFEEQMVSHCPLDPFEVLDEVGEVDIRTPIVVEQSTRRRPQSTPKRKKEAEGTASASDEHDGYIYITVDPTEPERFKLMTSSAKRLPTALNVKCAMHCANPSAAETRLMEDFAEFRVVPGKSIFNTECLQQVLTRLPFYCVE